MRAPPSRRRLTLLLVPIVASAVVYQVGDALAPTLVDTHPLLLIAMNPRNRNLALTTNLIDAVPYYLVGGIRLLSSDPFFYLLGWFYGDAGVRWLERRSPAIGRFARRFEAFFANASYPLVLIAPNPYICLLAGSAGMRPAVFFPLNIVGTIGRLALIRWFGDIFSGPIEDVIGFIQDNRLWLTGVTVSLVVIGTLLQRRRGTGGLETVGEIQHELEEELQRVDKKESSEEDAP